MNRQQKGTERDLFVKAADGSGREAPVVVNGLSKDPMSVSPDGRWMLYRESSKRFNDIWIAPLDGSGKPAPFIATEFDENYARFSPDGRWVVYSSAESGRWEVYIVPFPGPGGKWQVSTAGGELPRWRGDGREIFYLAADGMLMSVAVDGRSSAFQAGQAARLFKPRIPSPVGYNYAVSADGQRFLVNVSAEPNHSGGHHRRLAGAAEEVGGPVIAAFVIGAALVASTAGAQTDAAACNLTIASGVSTQQLVSGARQRTYRLFVPPGYDGRRRLPLVLDLHGSGGNAAGQARTSGFEAVAAAEAFLVATLDAEGARWNVPVQPGRADDVAYASDVIDHVAARACTGPDPRLRDRVLGRRPHVVAARLPVDVAPGGHRAGVGAAFSRAVRRQPAPVLTFHGLADPQNTYDGHAPGRGAEWEESVPDALAGWAARNGCKGSVKLEDPPGPLSTMRYEGCADDAEVRLISIDGLGHRWTREEIDTTAEIWRFFKSHSLRQCY